jgi:hypothetical protein
VDVPGHGRQKDIDFQPSVPPNQRENVGPVSLPAFVLQGGRMLDYVMAPPGWTSDDTNPFSADGSYGSSWSCFSTLGGSEYRHLTCRTRSGCWLFRINVEQVAIKRHLIDFIRYENENRRTVIVEARLGELSARAVADMERLTPLPGIIRESDEPFLVHSTDRAGWGKIRAAEELTASAFLPKGRNLDALDDQAAAYMRSEPSEYKEYIMLGSLNGPSTEVVVSCFQKGKMILSEDVAYDPGARLYLDNHALIRAGIDVRDGLHLMKVHGHLPLRYLAAVVTVDDVELPPGQAQWTPRTFTERANSLFARTRNGG